MSKATFTLLDEDTPLRASGEQSWGSPSKKYLSIRREDTNVNIFLRDWQDAYPLLAALQLLIGQAPPNSVQTVFELRHYRPRHEWEHVGLFSNLERAQGEGLKAAQENYGSKYIESWRAPYTPGVYSSVPNWRLQITSETHKYPMYEVVERELHS